MIALIIGAIILIIGTLVSNFTDEGGVAFSLGVIGSFIFSLGLLTLQDSCIPTAMDVYQGKTTLEYTIKDGVITDSIVVFKDSIK